MTDGTWWWGVGVFATLAAACGGQSITFEHTDGGAGRAPDAGVDGTSGTSAGTAGAGGSLANPTGGMAGLSGGAGRAGSNGFSAPDPEFNLGCDYKPIVATDCAKSGCHKGALAAAGLDLSRNDLVARLKDVPATFTGIQCSPPGGPGDPYWECVPAACPSGAFLVDSSNWEQSFMLSTLRGTQNGCGETMPDDAYRATFPDREACLEALVRAIAELPSQ
jgi:hypothetical protein